MPKRSLIFAMCLYKPNKKKHFLFLKLLIFIFGCAETVSLLFNSRLLVS